MIKIDIDLIDRIGNVFNTMAGLGCLGEVPICSLPDSKLDFSPDQAEQDFHRLMKIIKTEIKGKLFDRNSITKLSSEIDLGFADRVIRHLVGQKMVTMPNSRGRVKFA
ncbi:MAG: hypothetical protein WC069_02910 [Candidatus Shapirobacteria bacterium]